MPKLEFRPSMTVLEASVSLQQALACEVIFLDRAGAPAEAETTLRRLNSGKLISRTSVEFEDDWKVKQLLDELFNQTGLTVRLNYAGSDQEAADDSPVMSLASGAPASSAKEAPQKAKFTSPEGFTDIEFHKLRTENRRLKIQLESAEYEIESLKKENKKLARKAAPKKSSKKETPPAPPMPPKTNLITVERKNGQYTFLINGQKAGEAVDDGIFGPGLGFFVSGLQTVDFLDLKVIDPHSGSVVFHDDFNTNQHQWQVGDWDNNRRVIEKGAFHFQCKHPDKAYKSEIDVPAMESMDDFKIELITRQVSGSTAEYHYLLWGSDHENCYQFGVALNGRIRFLKYEDNQWHKIIKSSNCNSIRN